MRRLINLLYLLIDLVTIFSVILLLLPTGGYWKYIYFQKNKKVIIAYVEERYGKEYAILGEFIGSYSASGKGDDFITILQDGFWYRISALNGRITEDNYDRCRAGKVISDYIIDKYMPSSVYDKYTFYNEVYSMINITGNLSNKNMTIDDMKGNSSLNIKIDLELISGAKKKPMEYIWLYDIYKGVFSDFDNVDLNIMLLESESIPAYTSFQGFQGSRYSLESRFDSKEFFDNFH